MTAWKEGLNSAPMSWVHGNTCRGRDEGGRRGKDELQWNAVGSTDSPEGPGILLHVAC